jgi:type IV pilus biogenesis protein CpaD/CtpE
MRKVLATSVATLMMIGLSGCDQTEPYRRDGMWQPTGANSLNLAAMVANPNDLIRGRGVRGTPGIEAGPAVTAYWQGKPAPLPSSSSQSGSTGPAAPAPSAGAN